MKKDKRVILLVLSLVITVLCTSFSVFALNEKEYNTVSLTRGGSSRLVATDYVDVYTGSWWSFVRSVSFIGLPSGNWSRNSIVVRARTVNGTYEASDARTYTSCIGGYYPYREGYGGQGVTYTLYASMPSSSPSSGVTTYMEFCSY